MDNQHEKISGYRDLTQEEIDLMNEIKAFGPQLEVLIQKINQHIGSQYNYVYDTNERQAEEERLDLADPYQWLSVGTTNLKQGLMAITRAVAQPTFF